MPLSRYSALHKPALQLLQCLTFGFGIEEEHHDELNCGHRRKEGKGCTAAHAYHEYRKLQRDYGVHDPVACVANTLTLGANMVGKHFAYINPDDCALRQSEECY